MNMDARKMKTGDEKFPIEMESDATGIRLLPYDALSVLFKGLEEGRV
jgi:hypothetical protein